MQCLNIKKYLPSVQCPLRFLVEEREQQTLTFGLLAGNKLLSLSSLPLICCSCGHQQYSCEQTEEYKKDYRALAVAVREFGAQVSFSSVLPKRNGLKRPVKSAESTNGYRPGATAGDFST